MKKIIYAYFGLKLNDYLYIFTNLIDSLFYKHRQSKHSKRPTELFIEVI